MRGHGLNLAEDRMPMFMCLLNWTEQGIRSVKEAPKRAKAAQELAKKVGVDIKEVYLTSGDSDLLVILDTPNRRQIRACDQLARTRAYPHRSHLAAIRLPEADIGAAGAGVSDLNWAAICHRPRRVVAGHSAP
jgi:uncharacterized protein with GYD domain